MCTVSLWNKVAKYHKAKTVSVQLASDPMTVFVPVYWYVCVCVCVNDCMCKKALIKYDIKHSFAVFLFGFT